MVKCILDIGNAKYKLNRNALSLFMQEAQQHDAASPGSDDDEDQGSRYCETPFLDASLERVFNEVMQLYKEYAISESLDVLIRLKYRLEQVSLRYRSLALAEEVMNINSCLPYERRVPCNNGQRGSGGDAADANN